MGDVERVKRQKAAFMGQVITTCTKLKDLYAEPCSEVNKISVEGQLKNLESRYEKYTKAADEYYSLLQDDNEAEQTLELEQRGNTEEQYNEAQAYGQAKAARYKNEAVHQGKQANPVPQNTTRVHGTTPTTVTVASRVPTADNFVESEQDDFQDLPEEPMSRRDSGIRVPLLRQQTFDGNPDDWLGWWHTYKAGVHERPWDDVIKFAHLQTLLVGNAKLFIEGLPHTSGNYKKAIDRLLNEYQEDGISIERHIAALTRLPNIKANDVAALKLFRLQVQKHTDAIEALDYSTENLMSLGPTLLSKLPEYYIRKWHEDPDNVMTDYDKVVQFIDKQVKSAERLARYKDEFTAKEKSNDSKVDKSPKPQTNSNTNNSTASVSQLAAVAQQSTTKGGVGASKSNTPKTPNQPCLFCQELHFPACCSVATPKKWEIVKNQNRCESCLSDRHSTKDCKFKNNCRRCKGAHHTALCKQPKKDPKSTVISSAVPASTSQQTAVQGNTMAALVTSAFVGAQAQQRQHLMLATPFIVSQQGLTRILLMLDGGSTRSFISKRLADQLDLPKGGFETFAINVFGETEFQTTETSQYRRVTLRGNSDESPSMTICLLDRQRLCSVTSQPPTAFSKDLVRRGIDLADNRLTTEELQPDVNEIDLLIGTDLIWSFTNYLKQIQSSCGLRAFETKIGWVITGPHETKPTKDNIITVLSLSTCQASRETETVEQDAQLSMFWKLESLGILDTQEVPVDKELTEHQNSIYQLANGRFSSPLPWNDRLSELPSNKALAEGRINSLVRQLRKDRDLYGKYDEEIRAWEKLGFVQRVAPTTNAVTYLPHHPVVRKDKTTTKIRPVFDGSAKVKGGRCINDCLETGPNLNPDLLSVLLKFRQNRIAWTADIQQAFLMVELEPSDADRIRFLWIEDIDATDHQIVEMRWNRLPFGLNCSPYVLRAVIKKHLEKYRDQEPELVELILQSLYVDDHISGANTMAEAVKTTGKVKDIFDKAGMKMRKWITNCPELQQHFGPTSDTTSEGLLNPVLQSNDDNKVLGIKWSPESDTLSFNPTPLVQLAANTKGNITKRMLLKISAKFYDPIGLLSPVSLQLKILFQQLWLQVAKWDDPVPDEIDRQWREAMENLQHLTRLTIPRWTGLQPRQNFELHVFCDASKKAFGTAVYIRYASKDSWHTVLLCSKTRVAPLKEVTLPRLELLGAVLGTRLATFVCKTLNDYIVTVYYWLDSQVALAWIKGDSGKLNQFVKNRVLSIKQASGPSQWNYCPTKENPADLASRGAPAEKLVTSSLWWDGPQWLRENPTHWPKGSNELDDLQTAAIQQELKSKAVKKQTVAVVGEQTRSHWRPQGITTFNRVVKCVAYVIRATEIVRKSRPKASISNPPLSAEECIQAEMTILRWIQEESYPNELKRLKANEKLSQSSRIVRLNPTWDPRDQLIRVSARIEPALREQEIDPPILLPGKHPVVTTLIRLVHHRLHHAGVKTVVAELRNRYWIDKARQRTKYIIGRCVPCRKLHARAFDQIPAALPLSRTLQGRPFEVTGVDFAGPLLVKSKRKRMTDETPQDPKKVYICLFTCAKTRAVHLELVKDCHAKTFLLALRRFASRRGKPNIIYSDNATTFGCVNDHLDTSVTDDELTEWSATNQVKWRFSASLAPWWGGFWERMVRSVKDLLRRTIGKSSLTFDQLSTILVEIEGIINSRPLTYIAEGPDEPAPLTPNRLLTGYNTIHSLGGCPPTTDAPTSTREELARLDSSRQRILLKWWKQWQTEYLRDLESFHAKGKAKREVRIGDVVSIHAPNTKRLLWQIGVVTELIAGRDGRVRMVRLRTPNGGTLERAIQSLYPLEIQEPRPEDPEAEPSEPVESVATSDPEPEPQSHFCDSPGEDVGETFPPPATSRRGRTIRLPARLLD